jgi:hypothetical protein
VDNVQFEPAKPTAQTPAERIAELEALVEAIRPHPAAPKALGRINSATSADNPAPR